MSALEARLALAVLGDMQLSTPSEEEIAAGVEPGIEIHLPVGIPVPVGPNQAIGAPLGIITQKLTKEEAIEYFSEGLRVSEGLPDPKPQSDILVASNIEQVKQQAEEMKKFTKGA